MEKSPSTTPKIVKAHPEEWKDVKRMKFLMTDFRPRDANPEGYDDKMSFWVKTLQKWSYQVDATEFSLKSIRDSFEKDGHSPSISLLKTVVGSMLTNNQVMKRDVYKEKLNRSMTEGWISWGFTLATKPLSWGLSPLIGSSSSPSAPAANLGDLDEVLINVESIDSLANKLFAKYKDSSIHKYDTIHEEVEKDGITRSLLELILLKLQSEKRISIKEDCNFTLIKFGNRSTFTESEIGLVRLESAKELVEKEIRMIETNLEELKNEARNSIKEGNKIKAKQILKKKKRMELQFNKRESQLDNLEFLLEQLVESESHPTILTAMKAAADILKGADSKHDEIMSTLNEVEDVVHNHNEMVSDLSRSILDTTISNDAELEDELNELLLIDQEEKNKSKNVDKVIEGEKCGLVKDKNDEAESYTSKQENQLSTIESKGDDQSKDLKQKYQEQDQELQDLMDRLERLRSDALPDLRDEEDTKKEIDSKKMKEKVLL